MQPSDADLEVLLAQAKTGDRIAFSALIRSRQAMVYSIARNFLRNEGHAEDIAQDVFLELFKNINQIESPSHFVSWLRQVTSRKCIDQSRRAWFSRWVDLDDTHHSAVAVREPDPLLNGRVHHQLSKLPDKTRMMIVLRYQEEMEPNQIAETMNVPVGTVKSTIHRGLEQIRRRLGGAIQKGTTCLKTTI
jgi:RNA polymerase sigma-70 factor, ECF subfamily